jgi:hypothetical protein
MTGLGNKPRAQTSVGHALLRTPFRGQSNSHFEDTAMTWTTHTESSHHDLDEEVGAELAPGVVIERRAILQVPIAAALAAWLGDSNRLFGTEPGSAAGRDQGSLSWDEFIKTSVPLARELAKDASTAGQDDYLFRLAALAVRLQSAPNTKLFAFGGLHPKVEFAPSYRGRPFAIIQWRMYPHAVLPAHCHPQASVCTLGLEGEACLRHFEVHGDAPAFDSGSSRAFQIRETRQQVIGPKRVSTLSVARDNIHYFAAGSSGARGIDITTMYGGTGNFSFLAFDPSKPVDKVAGIFEAAWTGRKPPRKS